MRLSCGEDGIVEVGPPLVVDAISRFAKHFGKSPDDPRAAVIRLQDLLERLDPLLKRLMPGAR